MAISQKHIADALNLSVITVSRALRNYPHLAPETRARVLQKASELGYHKMSAVQPAQSTSSRPKRAGILFYEAPGQPQRPLGSRVREMIFYALQREARRLHVEVLVETVVADETPMLVRNRSIDVAFLFGRYTSESVKLLGGLPSLAVSSFVPCPGLPRVVADNVGGMRCSTEHLIELGHRRILFLGLEASHTDIFRERKHGYLIAMHERGLEPMLRTYSGWPGPSFAIPTEDLRGCTGIVCASDALAYYVLGCLGKMKLRVPEDRALVAFDHLQDDYPHSPCKITSYGPDWDVMGRVAADLMFAQPSEIARGDIVVTVPGALHVHGSSVPTADVAAG